MRPWLATFALLLLPGTALAGYKLLINDDFESGDTAAFQGGFGAGECWGVSYVPDAGDYPLQLRHVDTLIGGTGGHGLFTVDFYEGSSTNPNQASHIDGSYLYITGSNTSFNRIDLTDPKLKMTLPTIDSGNIIVSICTDNGGYPAIARDVGGLDYADRNWIYAHGTWWQANLLLVYGDWIQRLCVETDNVSGDECDVDADTDADTDTDTDADGDADADSDTDADTDTAWDTTEPGELSLISITPAEMNLGEPIDVVLLGSGFDGGMEARIGGIALTGTEVVNAETLQGRTPSSLPAGTHDVEVVLDADNAYLPAAFTVLGEEEGGCAGCSSTQPRGLAWLGLGLLGMMMLGWRRREG